MNFAYFLSNGKLKFYPENKKPVILTFKKGEYIYSDYQGPHRTENIGNVPLKFLSAELIKHP